MMNVISAVVNKDSCIGCGVCAGLCPSQALTMQVAANGDLSAFCDNSLCRPSCKLCVIVCPFKDGSHDPRPLNIELYSTQIGATFNENAGWHLESYVGYRTDEQLRKQSSSGGLLTACLEGLLEKNVVDRVAIVRRATFDSKQLFEFYGATTIEELRQAAGSIYHPVSIDQLLREINKDSATKWALVGVPCLCSAIRGLKHLRTRIPVVLGLACGMYQNTFYTELLAAHSGIPFHKLGNVAYRLKSPERRVNDYAFQAKDQNGTAGTKVHYLGLPYFLGRHAFFRFNACNFCKDVFAEAADACFMDAWLPEFMRETQGTSFVVIRNPVLYGFFKELVSRDLFNICTIPIEKVVQSQAVHVRRKRYLITMRQGNDCIASLEERIQWKLQRHIQEKSKRRWKNIGKKLSHRIFFLINPSLFFLPKAFDAAIFLKKITIRLNKVFRI